MLNKLFNKGLNPLYDKFNIKNKHDVETLNNIIREDNLNINPVTVRDMEVLGLKRMFECYTVNEIFNILRYYQAGGVVKREPVERWQPVTRPDCNINCNKCLYLKKGHRQVYCEFYKKLFNNECEHFFNKQGD